MEMLTDVLDRLRNENQALRDENDRLRTAKSDDRLRDLESQLHDIAQELFADLCEGDGQHSEELDRALILKHLKRAVEADLISARESQAALIAKWREKAKRFQDEAQEHEAGVVHPADWEASRLLDCAAELGATLAASAPAPLDERRCKHGHDHATPEGAKGCDGVLGTVYRSGDSVSVPREDTPLFTYNEADHCEICAPQAQRLERHRCEKHKDKERK